MKHTPTPWRVMWNMETGYNIQNNMGSDIGDMFTKPNAEYIIKCVNAHEELMEFVKYCSEIGIVGAEELIHKYGE